MSLNLLSLCRLCMCETKQLMFSLFNSKENIAERITILLPALKLSENDGLPSKICKPCLHNINIFYDFKIQCEISEETLRNYLASQQLAFQSCWNHGSASSNETKEQQNEQLANFMECKTELDIIDVKFEPDDVTTDYSANPLENSNEETQNGKQFKKYSTNLENCEAAVTAVVTEHTTSRKVSRKNSLKRPKAVKKLKKFSGTVEYSKSENIAQTNYLEEKQNEKKLHTFSGNVSLIQPNSEEELFECELCGKSFKQKYLMRKHVKRHAGARNHVCNICGRRFASNCNLKTHLLSHTGQRSHVCDICGKQFRLASHLKTHATVHSGARPHMCEICGKSYTQVGSLRQHAMKHSGERPFSCEMCNKSYPQKKSLEIHIATHTGARPHICSICGNNFAQPSALKSHIRSHTGVRRFVCSLCGVGYTKKKNLEKHAAKHVHHQIADKSDTQSSDNNM